MLAKKGKREVAVREEEKDHVLNKYAKEHSQKSRCYTCRSLGRYLFLEVQTPTPVSELLPSHAHHPVPGNHTIRAECKHLLAEPEVEALIYGTHLNHLFIPMLPDPFIRPTEYSIHQMFIGCLSCIREYGSTDE